ncbi:MAG: hypothetical protein LBQ94_00495 [Treponema sp.]|jgi:hypothetical protein|nr:hypothetical protein [Treponema sp.]
MDSKLKSSIEKILQENPNAPIDNLNKKVQIAIDEYNNTAKNDFQGLSPQQMYDLLRNDWGDSSISINPQKLDGSDIPFIQQIRYFIKLVNDAKEIKLTKAGYLPPTIVKDIYKQRFIPDMMIELGTTKLIKETDVDNIVVMKIICIMSGLIKKRQDKISLTHNAMNKIYANDFFAKIFEVVFKKFNWAYFDPFNDDPIGQFGNNYTLYLLNKYGDEWKEDEYYADLYFKAFPMFKMKVNEYQSLEICYIVRTFRDILKLFGFIEYEDKKIEIGNIRATDLFRKYIIIEISGA